MLLVNGAGNLSLSLLKRNCLLGLQFVDREPSGVQLKFADFRGLQGKDLLLQGRRQGPSFPCARVGARRWVSKVKRGVGLFLKFIQILAFGRALAAVRGDLLGFLFKLLSGFRGSLGIEFGDKKAAELYLLKLGKAFVVISRDFFRRGITVLLFQGMSIRFRQGP